MGNIEVPIAPGELIDKITILEIKRERIAEAAKLTHIQNELALLAAVRDDRLPKSVELSRLSADLRKVNESLWHIEDEIRECERRQDFGPRFIELARSVYHENDWRANLKREINTLFGSTISEQKSYAPYGDNK
jgi:hypothetical protein